MLPDDFLKRFNQIVPHHGDAEACFRPKNFKSFRVNTIKIKRDDVWLYLKDHDIPYTLVSWYADAFIVDAKYSPVLLESLLCTQGMIYAQGLESMLAPIVLNPQPQWQVLDLCAAPGSKTTQIAALMGNQGNLLANEPVRNRFFRLKSVVELLGAHVKLTSKDGRFYRGEHMFDGILVDAPCSSEGRFLIDRPKSYEFWSLRKIHEMAHKQKGLLLNASRLLKKGGTLVYATCTFGREENEEVVEWFLKKTQGEFKLEPITISDVPTYASSIPQCMRVMPSDVMEGFFLAKFSS